MSITKMLKKNNKYLDKLNKLSYFMKKISMNTFEKIFNAARGSKNYDIMTFNFEKYFKKVDKYKGKDRSKVGLLLELDANLYMMLGSGATKTEKAEVRKKSRMIYKEIKKYDKIMGDSFLKHQDKNE